MLSDGRIVGRAEPFAKVFASSRQVKRAVGVIAWAILEDIALDARLDVEGRLVAETNVRSIADNLGMSKNTVAKHLTRLRDHGFVLHEEHRANHSGLYTSSRYVLDPSACLERFTHTPTDPAVVSPVEAPRSTDRAESATEEVVGPCTNSWDTVDGTVSQSVGHRELGHNNKDVVVPQEEEQQQPAAEPGEPLPDALTALGIPPAKAMRLVAEHDPGRIRQVLACVTDDHVRNPAGWVVAALTRSWEVSPTPSPHAPEPTRAQPPPIDSQTDHNADRDGDGSGSGSGEHRRSQAWTHAAAELFDDGQLAAFVAVEADGPLAGFTVSGPRLLAARIASRLAAVHLARPDLALPDAVDRALPALAGLRLPNVLPACPYESVDVDVGGLDARLRRLSAPS